MSLEIWITFTVASAVLLAMPGPTVLLVVSYAIKQGKSSGWATVPGVALGDLAAATVVVWAVLAGEMRAKFQRPELLNLLNRTGGGFLVGAGLITVAIRE